MKKGILAASAILASTLPSLATNVTINLSFTEGASNAVLIEDSNGDAATGAYVFIGSFTSAPSVSSSISDISANFRQFSSTVMGPTPQDGIDGFPGLATGYTDHFDNSPQNQSNFDFTGLGIFVVIANVSDVANLADATEIAVITDNDGLASWIFPTVTDPPPTDQFLNMFNDVDSDDVVIGSLDTLTIGGSFAGTYTSIKLQAIPEPSSFALLGLGAVATLFRRRR